MTIGVSKLTENYESWLRSGDADMTIINLYDEPDVAAAIARCDGILFSGGNDVNPKLYGHEEYLPLCYGVDEHRDEIERELISRAEANTLPMLAICRGLQMFNVVKGGTLFADIYAQNNITTIHTKNKEIFTDAAHPVDIEPGTLLHKITKTLHGTINSSHHQAVAELAPELRIAARAPDGTIEALEWKEPSGKPFFLAVQWHPERMERSDSSAPFSRKVLEHFLFEVQSHIALTKEH